MSSFLALERSATVWPDTGAVIMRQLRPLLLQKTFHRNVENKDGNNNTGNAH